MIFTRCLIHVTGLDVKLLFTKAVAHLPSFDRLRAATGGNTSYRGRKCSRAGRESGESTAALARAACAARTDTLFHDGNNHPGSDAGGRIRLSQLALPDQEQDEHG